MIARVTLDIVLRKEFDYSVPCEFQDQLEVGSRVKVPFQNRQVLGSVTALADSSPHTHLRPILQVLGNQALLTPKILQLTRWLADYYCCPLEVALKSVLPEAVRNQEKGWRERLVVRALPSAGELPRLTSTQHELWSIIEARKEIALQDLIELARTTAATVRRLEDRGLISIETKISERDPYAREVILPTLPLSLNTEQELALEKITTAMEARRQAASGPLPGASARAAVFLLHGVTGSGKTEIYLQAIARALEHGQGAIVLVPEISLTPQTVERFKARFSSGPLRTLVAVLHSHLSAGERHDEWHKIRQGRARIVIGARSAIFAPVDPLGLIIVDEEHEHSYKQEEAPRYHARDVAVVRAQLERATAVLGSATPSLESFHNAQKGKYQLLQLLARADNKKLPRVRVIDMRSEARRAQGGTPVFSRILQEAMTSRLEKNEQTMLFLNRRGYAASLQCPLCGYVAGCPDCSIALTYHRSIEKLCCHLCGHSAAAPEICPEPACRNPAIRYAGLGTQRIEATLIKLFPRACVQRLDADALKRKGDMRRILADFRSGKIDILVGTQMIAKGLHFPNVTLVGIIHADLSLHIPDFRAGERTFQLLVQVSGRAGRGDVEGEVVVQAFTPFNPAIQYARRHDFAGFYEQELEFREQLKYPPITRAAMLTLRARNEDKAKLSADYVKGELEKGLSDFEGLILAGPAPSPLLKAKTYYRYQIMLRTGQMSRLSRRLATLLAQVRLPEDVTLIVDIDPVNLL
jgi:primosomal protein N' (replication factor Y) (superfamily II helicase)